MKLFHYTNLKEFNTFEEIYKPNVYYVCDLLKKFSINVHNMDKYINLLVIVIVFKYTIYILMRSTI